MTSTSSGGQPPSSSLTPEECASCNALVRKVSRGDMMAVMPVQRAEIGNRVLEAARELLEDYGFLVVVIDGAPDDAVRTAWSRIAAARIAASKESALRSTVLIIKDAHLLGPGKLDVLTQAGDLAIVAAPVVRGAARQSASVTRFLGASVMAAPVLAALALGHFLWPAIQRDVSQTTNIQRLAPAADEADLRPIEAAAISVPPAVAPDAVGAPGLLIRAGPGDTLETLYQRIYRGVTPPPFASVAALNPDGVRPGAIVTFPEPVNGWPR